MKSCDEILAVRDSENVLFYFLVSPVKIMLYVFPILSLVAYITLHIPSLCFNEFLAGNGIVCLEWTYSVNYIFFIILI